MNWLRQIVARKAVFRRLPRLLRKGRVAILLVWAALIFWVTQSGPFAAFVPFQDLEQRSIDWRFKARGPRPAHPSIVIVGIKDSSMDTGLLGARAAHSPELAMMAAQRFTSWDRRVWAKLTERLMAAGAKVVALDLIFDGSFPGSDAMAELVKKYGDRLVLGSKFERRSDEDRLTYRTPDSAIIGDADQTQLLGSCGFGVEVDGVIRRFNFRTSIERESGKDEAFLSDFGIEDDIVGFAPLAAAKFGGLAAASGRHEIINFQGNAETYPAYAMEDILDDSIFLRSPLFEQGAVFKNKIVFIGPVAEIIQDIHKTPFGLMPGVQVHAQLAAGLLGGTTLRDAPGNTARWLALGTAVLAAGLLVVCRQALTQSLVMAGATVIFAVATHLCFTRGGVIIPVIAPTFTLLGIGVFGVLFSFAIEQMEKARIRGAFDQYVSKNVADVVLRYAEDFEQMMRGERKNVTVVFSDVRGFTSIFESSDATALVEQLNEYFERMVRCIQEEGGTLQKFIGDAIMAAWGDTHSLGYGEDAERAVRSALAMRVALRELNAQWVGIPARVPMKTGIGVNHGEVVVGEIGSQGVRKEFTLLGDAVNSAARFESATKQYHVDLLVGGSVEALTRGKFVYRAVDRARFKGKMHPIDVFTVIGDGGNIAPLWLGRWHEAVELFRMARFADATRAFRAVAAEIGGEDFLCEMYLERIAEYEQSPPPADWDGAHTLVEK